MMTVILASLGTLAIAFLVSYLFVLIINQFKPLSFEYDFGPVVGFAIAVYILSSLFIYAQGLDEQPPIAVAYEIRDNKYYDIEREHSVERASISFNPELESPAALIRTDTYNNSVVFPFNLNPKVTSSYAIEFKYE